MNNKEYALKKYLEAGTNNDSLEEVLKEEMHYLQLLRIYEYYEERRKQAEEKEDEDVKENSMQEYEYNEENIKRALEYFEGELSNMRETEKTHEIFRSEAYQKMVLANEMAARALREKLNAENPEGPQDAPTAPGSVFVLYGHWNMPGGDSGASVWYTGDSEKDAQKTLLDVGMEMVQDAMLNYDDMCLTINMKNKSFRAEDGEGNFIRLYVTLQDVAIGKGGQSE